MASKKFLELQEFTHEELTNELAASQAEYQKLQLDNALKGLDNPLVLREMRRDIARLQTAIRASELKDASPEVLAGRSKILARRRKR